MGKTYSMYGRFDDNAPFELIKGGMSILSPEDLDKQEKDNIELSKGNNAWPTGFITVINGEKRFDFFIEQDK